jgi:hypothetical protein
MLEEANNWLDYESKKLGSEPFSALPMTVVKTQNWIAIAILVLVAIVRKETICSTHCELI